MRLFEGITAKQVQNTPHGFLGDTKILTRITQHDYKFVGRDNKTVGIVTIKKQHSWDRPFSGSGNHSTSNISFTINNSVVRPTRVSTEDTLHVLRHVASAVNHHMTRFPQTSLQWQTTDSRKNRLYKKLTELQPKKEKDTK
jgi:hypothetical protein